MSPLLASILLSVLSAVAYAAAAVLQERLAATTAPSRYALLRRGRWWLAVVLNGAGALLHVAALGLGPLTVVQPLGVLTIVVAAPMGALLVGRPVTAAAWRGVVLVSVGLAGVLLFTGARASRPLTGAEQYGVAGAAAAAIALLVATAAALRGARRARARSVALAVAAGISFGTASVCVKAVAEGWALTSLTAALPVLGLIAVFAVTGLVTAQASYRGGGLAAPLATTTVVNPVLAAAVGLMLLDEGFRHGTGGALTALGAAVLAGWGLVVLTRDSVARRAAEGAEPVEPGPVVIPAPAQRPEHAVEHRPEPPRHGVPVPLPAAHRGWEPSGGRGRPARVTPPGPAPGTLPGPFPPERHERVPVPVRPG
ncbi:DMT family transporter [Streptomyces sp. JJ36]|uniref:DMT family transporter n=1 Tax=Streptomyces sp. JJ36 TaxID=2736645 RepID=UPI001F3D4F04|nr:DMT family transporter [Streptomyces sp. JJ36]MCF6524347.1 DMT family transporter [Streptomyces sp. JJ36]